MMFGWMGGALLCAVSGLVLLIVATATDFWMQYRYSGSLSNQGLWRFCVGNKCHPHTITLAFWDATRAFMLISILSSFAGIILGLMTYTGSARFSRSRSAGVILLIAGLFALLALSVYTGVTVNFYGKRYTDWRFSWSYILGWIAIVLTIAAGTGAPGGWTEVPHHLALRLPDSETPEFVHRRAQRGEQLSPLHCAFSAQVHR
ncbi:lens fiber membrane intrinsic protein-like [Candoia aspera]|uniref:lens fiber membrane intrinsic protein-like n=1 Tax=Candoia aspera TaxID=51853 RepID=UPI002FD7FB97